MLTADCCLSMFFSLPEQCHLFIVIFDGLYAHTSTIWPQCSWWRYRARVIQFPHAPGDHLPRFPIGHCVHAMWSQNIMLLIRITPSVAWYHGGKCVRRDLNLDMSQSFWISSWNICRLTLGSTYRNVMPHCPAGWIECATIRYYANVELDASARNNIEHAIAMHTVSNEWAVLL